MAWVCPISGFASMTSQPGDAVRDDAVHFHERLSQAWAGSYAKPGFRRRLQVLRLVLDEDAGAGGTWIDLGCGAGVLTRELLARSCDVIAVDGSPGMLKAAQEYCGTGGTVRWHLGDVQDLSFLENRAVDGILCSSVVEYLPGAEKLLMEAARVLRGGGRLIVSIPPRWAFLRTIQKVQRKLWGLVGLDVHPYLTVSTLEMSRREVSRLLARHGFRLVGSRSFDPLLPAALVAIVRPSLIVYRAVRSFDRQRST